MTAMTISADKRVARRGETLIEIMASIMVLSIGLVGVLAAIPFGGFRMSQMTEADNSAAVGRNAVRTVRVNGWAHPKSWLNEILPYHTFNSNAGTLLYQNADVKYIDSTVPFVLDPLGSLDPSGSVDYYPRAVAFSPNGGYATSLVRVSPMPQDESGVYYPLNQTDLTDWYEYLFYQRDDLISGYYAEEDETEFRPRVQMEGEDEGGSSDVPSFSGRCSWLAFVYPKSTSTYANESPFSSVISADFDAVVLRDRIIGDEKAFAAKVVGSGYRGGSVTIDLSTCRDSDNNVANSDIDYSRIREQLIQTRYIMLVGAGDDPKASSAAGGVVFPTHAAWYKIANCVDVDPDHISLTLIGENTPRSWLDIYDGDGNLVQSAKPVTAIFYPGAIGVYSGSATF